MLKKNLTCFIGILWCIKSSFAQTPTGFWEAIPGLDGSVDIIRVSGNDLIVGGLFTSADGDSNASHIAKWNGSGWEPLGIGLDDWAHAIIVDGNDLYVAGSFSKAGDQPGTSYIARWDGTNWNSVGGGLNLHVNALAVKDSALYVGGVFRNAGGNPDADRIAKWNGANWEAMDKGLNNWVFTIAINNNGEIFAGGTFTAAAADTNVKFIAKWNDVDSLWEPFGNGLNHQVHHIGFNGDQMYIGGYFTDAGGDPTADRIAKWNGTSWEGLGPGLNGNYDLAEVEEFAFDGDDIYVVGLFNIIGDDSTFSNIAKWNGSAWEKMGIGVDQEARSLAILNDDLYIGGSFQSEVWGGDPYLPHIAKRSNFATAVEDNNTAVIRDFKLYQNYPNPFNPTTKISWQSAAGSWQTLKIYDVLGNKVATLVDEYRPAGSYEVEFNAFNLPSGVYFYNLQSENFKETKKLILMK
jgi:hypothetical protein